ncbi:hypothetical protein [Jeotgalibacillus proteolyticus]|uniref:YqgU-like 6-bladed beta-propeller domain-containing protein n=1 Tax=Jeotgalibacillus proteolyticus TaxID=2082395 RepID=A0A2S5GEN5_9BACL|nr:hypothetical protein [Jeotgalibacillus proteolyticus]PPA71408.1 hypothetical protein C4B60_04910 [Jeotgalibacillus proteolyticus]
MKNAALIVYSLSFAVFFAGCFPANKVSMHEDPSVHSEAEPFDSIIPLVISENDFHSVVDWTDNTAFIYITQSQHFFSVNKYDILTGKSNVILTREGKLNTASLSPSKELLLLHEADEVYGANASVLMMNSMKEVWSQPIESYELAYSWNPADERKILFTAFDENWEYEVWTADIEKSEWQQLSGIPPFLTWSSEASIIYQTWSKEMTEPHQAVYEYFIETGIEKQAYDDVFAFDLLPEMFITVKVDEEKESFTFEIEGYTKKIVFEVPAVHTYSQWVLPEYDIAQEAGKLILFKPNKSGELYSKDKGFSLVSLNLNTNEETIINQLANNEPLACSPNGLYCLTGYQLTSIAEIEKGEISSLIIFEEDLQ